MVSYLNFVLLEDSDFRNKKCMSPEVDVLVSVSNENMWRNDVSVYIHTGNMKLMLVVEYYN